MKKIAAVVLAGALATASVGATTQSAEAHGLGGAIVVGALVGLGFLALTHHYSTTAYAYYPTTSYAYAPNSHVAWCQSHYRSYNVATDSYLGYDGFYHRCAAPY
jgi:hypothetical protein